MITVKNGESRDITFTLGGGLTVAQLGTPTVILSQDLRTFALEIKNSSGGTVTANISKALSLLLVAGLDTVVQLSFNDGHGGVLVFPEEHISIEEQFNEIEVDKTIPIDDEEETLDVEIPEEDYDESGELLEDYEEYVAPLPDPTDPEEEVYEDDEDFEELSSYDNFVEEGDDGEIIEDGFEDEDEGAEPDE